MVKFKKLQKFFLCVYSRCLLFFFSLFTEQMKDCVVWSDCLEPFQIATKTKRTNKPIKDLCLSASWGVQLSTPSAETPRISRQYVTMRVKGTHYAERYKLLIWRLKIITVECNKSRLIYAAPFAFEPRRGLAFHFC